MHPLARRLIQIVAALGVLVLLVAGLVVGSVWLTMPDYSGNQRLPGLSSPVSITFDADAVPRIRANSAMDGAEALGYVHARDRMFQMELMRRSASGRLSEVVGPLTLPMDRMMRTLGLRRAAIADLETLPPDAHAMLDAYARGVNAWIRQKGRFAAPEFLLLGAPEPWTPADSLLWAKTMGLWLSMNYRQELARQALAGTVSPEVLDQLWPPYQKGASPDAALPFPTRFAQAASRLARVLPDFPAPFTMPRSASNEWAVDGRLTATASPLLAGDPHLQLGFPGIWYLARIETPGGVLAGATAPGVPFLVLGHNGKIAWTFTTTGADVQDIFIETPAGTGQYQTPEGPAPFTVHEEPIKVRGQPDQLLIVRETRHGPVISDLDNPSGPILAVSMGNLQPGDIAAAGLLALNQSGSVGEAGAAAARITSPVQNLLVADHDTIGLFMTGRIPIRKAGDGSAPVPGDGSHDWAGWASGDQLPHTVSPASGRLVNGNEPVWSPNFPVFLGRDTFGDWRSQRIREMLATSQRHTAASFAAMQADVVDPFARRTLPRLIALTGTDGLAARAQAQLRNWDGSAVMDSPAPLIFTAWMDDFRLAIQRKAGLTRGFGAPAADMVTAALGQGTGTLCGGNCDTLLRQSLDSAAASLAARFGNDPAAWRWGDAHTAVFAHPILQHIPLLGALTTISVPAPGDNDTVDRGATSADLQDVHGASYRGVYDLGNLDRSLFMMAPGQSGNPFSRHARDFLLRWRDGATITLGPVPAGILGTLQLTP